VKNHFSSFSILNTETAIRMERQEATVEPKRRIKKTEYS